MIKPLLKRAHHVLRSSSGDLCIGEIPGRSKVIASPPAWVEPVLALLDGEHTLARIWKELSAKGNSVAADELNALVASLHGFGLLEDGALRSARLSASEIERYDRQILQFSIGSGACDDASFTYQERLKDARVLILGMGGWGTWCALNLALLGVGTLRIVDGDTVETSNLNRQVLYRCEDVGSNKVDAAVRALAEHNPHVRVEPFMEFVSAEPSRLNELMRDVDAVLIAWASLGYFRKDTAEAVVHDVARNTGVPVLELGGDPFNVSVGPLYPYGTGDTTFAAVRESQQRRFYSEDPRIRSFQEARLRNDFCDGARLVNAWQSAPSLSVMAGLACDELVRLLTGYEACRLVGRRTCISLQDFTLENEVVFVEQ